MAFSKKAIAKAWDIEGLANDLRDAVWYVTEGPHGHQRYTRIDRRTLLGTADVIERAATSLLSKQEIKEAEKPDTRPTLLYAAAEEDLNALTESVAKGMGPQVSVSLGATDGGAAHE